MLFNDSVRNNIAYGSADRFTQAQVEQAARAANAHDFIVALPNGYDTVLGDRGTRLSGGQRQRLAIARALLVDPPILILDEATSALDTESERLVQEAVDRLLAGRTVFVIAHRLSTVVHADTILVLDHGRIKPSAGTHASSSSPSAARTIGCTRCSSATSGFPLPSDMRVLFYVGDKQWSGSSRRDALMAARGLSRSRGHPVTIACCGDARLDRVARDAGIETVAINASSSTAGGAWDLRKVLKERFIEVAMVGNERDHLIVSSAMRFAERGSVLRRIPSFEKMDLLRSGKFARKMASTGLVVSSQRELKEIAVPGWPIPASVAPLGV